MRHLGLDSVLGGQFSGLAKTKVSNEQWCLQKVARVVRATEVLNSSLCLTLIVMIGGSPDVTASRSFARGRLSALWDRKVAVWRCLKSFSARA